MYTMFPDYVGCLIFNTTSQSSPDSYIHLCVSNTTASPAVQIALSHKMCRRHDRHEQTLPFYIMIYVSTLQIQHCRSYKEERAAQQHLGCRVVV